jgi:hypothetical protein
MPSHLWIAATSRCASPELATERMAVPRARINAEGFAAAPVRFGGGDGSLDWSHAWSGRRISSLSRAHSTPDRPPPDASLVFCDLDSGGCDNSPSPPPLSPPPPLSSPVVRLLASDVVQVGVIDSVIASHCAACDNRLRRKEKYACIQM